jgi:hypothetical protein
MSIGSVKAECAKLFGDLLKFSMQRSVGRPSMGPLGLVSCSWVTIG